MFALTAFNSSKTTTLDKIEEVYHYSVGHTGAMRGIGYLRGRLVLFDGKEGDAGRLHYKPITLKQSAVFQSEMHNDLLSRFYPDGSGTYEGRQKWYRSLANAIR